MKLEVDKAINNNVIGYYAHKFLGWKKSEHNKI